MTRPPIAGAACLLFVALAMPSFAVAGHRSGRGSIIHSDLSDVERYEIEYEDRNAIQLQREAISAQEERQREEGRRVRRDELERLRRERTADFLDSRESMRESSHAARRAPRGAYYRRPGSSAADLPSPSETVTAGGVEYGYYEGIFYRPSPSGYDVVFAPLGAAVDVVPERCTPLQAADGPICYYFGTFFRKSRDGGQVVLPPSGLVVPYLPDGYLPARGELGPVYRFGTVLYRPYYREGVLVYVVTGTAPQSVP